MTNLEVKVKVVHQLQIPVLQEIIQQFLKRQVPIYGLKHLFNKANHF